MMPETEWDRRQRFLTQEWFRARPQWERLLKGVEAEQMLERILEAIRSQSLEDALDIIYDEVDDALLGGQFDVVDEMLGKVDPQEIPTVYLVGLLVITNMARDRLKSRKGFGVRVRAHLEKVEPHRVEGLLVGLE